MEGKGCDTAARRVKELTNEERGLTMTNKASSGCAASINTSRCHRWNTAPAWYAWQLREWVGGGS